MSTNTKPIECLGSYIRGDFEFSPSLSPNKNFEQVRKSPADFEDIVFRQVPTPLSSITLAVKEGEKAYLPWTRLKPEERAKKLAPLKQIIKRNLPELSQTISREIGKPLWESEGEVKSLIAKVDFVLKEGLNRIRKQEILPAKGQIRFKSRGLFVVVGPFNFPMHLPLGQILPALISGNTVIFKPSEKAPATGQKLAELFHKLNLPVGVFQMLTGGARLSAKLCTQPLVDGVFFTGSFKTGQKIKEALLKDPFKILALEMGGYNSALIWDNSSIEQALTESLKGSFFSAGQRCSSTSQIILHKSLSEEFAKEFVRQAQKLSVDHYSQNPFMGPLIDQQAVQRHFSFQKEIQKAGGETLLESHLLKSKKGHYVGPGIYKMSFTAGSPIGTEETFTPQVILYETEDLDQALDIIHHSQYGLSLSLFTKDPALREEMFYRAKVGLIHYNLSTIGASGFLPFGGLGKSGNDRPAGAFAIDSCVSPLAERFA